MNERANFKDSVRRVALQIREPSEPVVVEALPGTARESSSGPNLVKPANEATIASPVRPRTRRVKQPMALEWLKARTNFKQVSVELPPELHQMVIRASHGQRMSGRFPGNIREIYSVAAVEWMERNSWFRPDEVADDESENRNEEF
jgi:hypothetical protein